jgi:predicted homoserine dehydrogenase-like protein
MNFKPFATSGQKVRVGVSGTGFISRGLLAALANSADFDLGKVFTRRAKGEVESVDLDLLTNSIEELVESSDIVVESSGDVWRGAEVVDMAMRAGKPVVTMGTEFHVTVGSYFADRGYLTEAEGDQPGSLAAHVEDVVAMGFEPIVYGNIKGFLNHYPTEEEMEYWSKKNGISIEQTISFTDGTKMQMEQVLVANHFGAEVACRGMKGPETMPLEIAGAELGRLAKAKGTSLSDYVLNRTLPAGVFVVAEHPYERPEVLRYLKLGDGPYYTLLRGYHLCHLEVIKTLRRVVAGKAPLMNNSAQPKVVVAAVAKQSMAAGQLIERAAGGYLVRGEAAMAVEVPDAVPIGLLDGARLVRSVEKGQTLSWSDVETRQGLALDAGLALKERMLSAKEYSSERGI